MLVWIWRPIGSSRTRKNFCSSFEVIKEENSLLSNEGSTLLGSSTDWMRPTHHMESNLLYSKSNNVNINLIWKIPSQQYLSWCLTKSVNTRKGTQAQPLSSLLGCKSKGGQSWESSDLMCKSRLDRDLGLWGCFLGLPFFPFFITFFLLFTRS